jgi:tetratricopeptide (TPR) repeat protein
MARRAPGVLIGWLWFLGTLVPVSGLVQTGVLSMADRYAYVPLIGLFIAVVFAVPAVRLRPALAAPAGVAVLLALSVCTWRQVGHWRDTPTLFTHAVACTDRNFVAHTVLGTQLANRRQTDAAEAHFHEALRIEPRYPAANANYGFLLLKRGRHDAALAHFRKAAEVQPSLAPAHLGIALALDAADRWPEARLRFHRAIELRPEHARFRAAYAAALLKQGETEAALHELRIAANHEPDQPRVHYLFGRAYERRGRLPDAVEAYKLSSKLDPYSTTAWDAMRRCKAELTRAAAANERQASAAPAADAPN